MASIQHKIPASVNPDLQKERCGTSFNIQEFQEWWHGGPEKLKQKREDGKFMFIFIKIADIQFFSNFGNSPLISRF